MLQHIKLESEKYWHESLKEQKKEYHRLRNRQAVGAFGFYLFGIAVIYGTKHAVQQMPTWVPQVTAFVESTGLPEIVRQFV